MLFIGGPEDGKTADLLKNETMYQSMEIISTQSKYHFVRYKEHIYYKVPFRGDDKTFYIMIHESLTIDDMIFKLINNYKIQGETE